MDPLQKKRPRFLDWFRPKPRRADPEPGLGDLFFGVANADHQVEAFDPAYPDIRDYWEDAQAQTRRGRAADFEHRYREDIALAAGLGCSAFRFSISWARVEPRPGEYNSAAIEYYRQVVSCILEAGLRPVITLLHFTWPLHIQESGGLLDGEFPRRFASYARHVAREIGPPRAYWITFNEPNLVAFGYIKPWWQKSYPMPPGQAADQPMSAGIHDAGRLIRNIFMAHRLARDEIRAIHPEAKVGANPFVLGMPPILQWLVDLPARWVKDSRSLDRSGRVLTEQDLVRRARVDLVLAGLSSTTERAELTELSEAYGHSDLRALVDDANAALTPAALATERLAVVRRSSAERFCRRHYPRAILTVFPSHRAVLAALGRSEVQAAIVDFHIVAPMVGPNEGFSWLPGTLHRERIAVALPKGDRDLLKIVNDAIEAREAGLPEIPASKSASTSASVTNGDTLAKIRRRGHLLVGVRDNVPGIASRDPASRELSGFEIDLARAIGRRIFGKDGQVKFRILRTGERVSLLTSPLSIFKTWFQSFSIIFSVFTSNWWQLGMHGSLNEYLCPSECVGQQDFVGFDYYWGTNSLRPRRLVKLWKAALAQFDQAPVWPGGLRRALEYHARLFPGQEIVIVENGCIEQVDGYDRATYLTAHLREVLAARASGVPVAGYICWSITSNREWGLPFNAASDFGLYHVGLDTDPALARQKTPAATAYADLIADYRSGGRKGSGQN